MARIKPVADNVVTPSLKAAFEQHVTEYNARITNMKATLGHSLLCFEVYMQWYPLYEKVKEITGERAAWFYAYSISYASDCPLCSTFFRKIIVEAGYSPESMVLSDYENSLLHFGSAIALHKGCIANHVYNAVARYHTSEEIVVLTAFAGQMIATNVFNNVIETEIDEYLLPYVPVKYCV